MRWTFPWRAVGCSRSDLERVYLIIGLVDFIDARSLADALAQLRAR
jgi:hypothetical protein